MAWNSRELMSIAGYASNALVGRPRHFKIIAGYHRHTPKKKGQVSKPRTASAIAASAA